MENSINENSGLLEQKALNVLHEYEGANNYILKLKGIFNPNKRGIPTRSQCEYILNYSNTTPKVAKKWVEMDDYFSEKISNEKNCFYCDNIDMKSIPEELNKKFNVTLIARNSKIERTRQLNLEKIETSSNIFTFLFNINAALN